MRFTKITFIVQNKLPQTGYQQGFELSIDNKMSKGETKGDSVCSNNKYHV